MAFSRPLLARGHLLTGVAHELDDHRAGGSSQAVVQRPKEDGPPEVIWIMDDDDLPVYISSDEEEDHEVVLVEAEDEDHFTDTEEEEEDDDDDDEDPDHNEDDDEDDDEDEDDDDDEDHDDDDDDDEDHNEDDDDDDDEDDDDDDDDDDDEDPDHNEDDDEDEDEDHDEDHDHDHDHDHDDDEDHNDDDDEDDDEDDDDDDDDDEDHDHDHDTDDDDDDDDDDDEDHDHDHDEDEDHDHDEDEDEDEDDEDDEDEDNDDEGLEDWTSEDPSYDTISEDEEEDNDEDIGHRSPLVQEFPPEFWLGWRPEFPSLPAGFPHPEVPEERLPLVFPLAGPCSSVAEPSRPSEDPAASTSGHSSLTKRSREESHCEQVKMATPDKGIDEPDQHPRSPVPTLIPRTTASLPTVVEPWRLEHFPWLAAVSRENGLAQPLGYSTSSASTFKKRLHGRPEAETQPPDQTEGWMTTEPAGEEWSPACQWAHTEGVH